MSVHVHSRLFGATVVLDVFVLVVVVLVVIVLVVIVVVVIVVVVVIIAVFVNFVVVPLIVVAHSFSREHLFHRNTPIKAIERDLKIYTLQANFMSRGVCV